MTKEYIEKIVSYDYERADIGQLIEYCIFLQENKLYLDYESNSHPFKILSAKVIQFIIKKYGVLDHFPKYSTKFNQFLSIVESKKNSLDQLKGLIEGLEREIRFIEENVNQQHHEMFKRVVRERYARMANRVIKDLRFDAKDFISDQD